MLLGRHVASAGAAEAHHGSTIVARRAHSPSSPSRRTAALPLRALGLDRSARPSEGGDRAINAAVRFDSPAPAALRLSS